MQQKLNEILLKRLIFLCSFWYCAIPFKISHLGVSNKPARLILFFICLQVILKCNVNDSSFLISQVYNMVLISVCTYYAVMTRKVRKHLANRNFKILIYFLPSFYNKSSCFCRSDLGLKSHPIFIIFLWTPENLVGFPLDSGLE